jgi:hypothetical protein
MITIKARIKYERYAEVDFETIEEVKEFLVDNNDTEYFRELIRDDMEVTASETDLYIEYEELPEGAFDDSKTD